MGYDLVIRGGMVVDGTGLPAFRADVGVRGNRIAAIGPIDERGAREIDASGHAVCPGFIDIHTHMDAQVFWDPLGESSCWHGVTSVVMGNCGFTLAPARQDQRDLVISNLERAEDIPRSSMEEGIKWTWETFGEYLDAVDQLPKGINYAANIGHSALRVWAMGDRAFTEEASEDDLEEMQTELKRALHAGAIGFTTSRSAFHRTLDDRPVASRIASWQEICRLVGVMRHRSRGVFELAQVHHVDPDSEEGRSALGALRSLAVDSGIPVTFGLVPGVWAQPLVDMIDSAAEAGGRMIGQTRSRNGGQVLSFKTHLPFDRLSGEWQEFRHRPLDHQLTVLRTDPQTLNRLVDAAISGLYPSADGAEVRPPNYDVMRVLRDPEWESPTVADVAAERRLHPAEAMIRLCVESDLEQFFMQTASPERPEELLALMKHPRTMMSFSDSGAHISQMMGACIQTHLLAYWVRHRQEFTLEDAVKMLTLTPAITWGIPERGCLRDGYIADINVIDPETIAPVLPRVVTDLPAEGQRLIQKSRGILATVVGGEVLFLEGKHTGALPGVLIRARAN